jgi:hypothetical protein
MEKKMLNQLPELRELKQIHVPQEYQGQPPQRVKDYLTGFQIAWELALRMQQGQPLEDPRQ